MDGCYYIDSDGLRELRANNQVLWTYTDRDGAATPASNPNGSIHNIAGVCNRAGNVAGLMPHPERAAEDILGEESGLAVFKSMLAFHQSGKAFNAASSAS
jgi:phosphoribosylformylglycinamidine synthase